MLVLPWWLSAIILIGLTIYIPLYLEVLFFGFLFDTLYSASKGHVALISATIFILVVTFIRTRIRT